MPNGVPPGFVITHESKPECSVIEPLQGRDLLASSNCFSRCCKLSLPQAWCHYRLVLTAGTPQSHHWLPPYKLRCSAAPQKTQDNDDDEMACKDITSLMITLPL